MQRKVNVILNSIYFVYRTTMAISALNHSFINIFFKNSKQLFSEKFNNYIAFKTN